MRNHGQHGSAWLVAGVRLAVASMWLATQPASAAVAATQGPEASSPQPEHVASVSKVVSRPPKHALVPNPDCSVPAEADMVRCDTIVLDIPADAIVTRVVRRIRELGDEVPHTFWIDDDGVYRGCRLRPGWCSATAIKRVTEAGKQTFSYAVKNWKFDRDREFLLEVHYTQPPVTANGSRPGGSRSSAARGAYPLAGITPQAISIGVVLTDVSGATLYTFDGDTKPNKSTCTDRCAQTWPPLYVNFERVEGVYEIPGNVGGDWSMVDREDGRKQWAYKAKPLYTYAGERYFGESKGDGLGGQWHAARP